MNISPMQIVAALIFGGISAYIAGRARKNPYKWFFVGFFFGLLGLFFLLFLPKLRQKEDPPNLGPVFRGPADRLWFYLDPTHRQIGPVSASAIERALKEGNLSQESYVWHENLSDWKQIKEFSENPT